MEIFPWPLVTRDRVVHAFKLGEPPSSEAPFRTLRTHRWATAGVRIVPRTAARLAGQMTVFSALNVEAARLARHGKRAAATRVAKAAAMIEASPDFARLKHELAQLSRRAATGVLEGALPEKASGELLAALRAIARRTDDLRAHEPLLRTASLVVSGRISEVRTEYVVLDPVQGAATAVPRWMAKAAGRENVGEALALVIDRLEGSSAVFDAVPALEDEPSAAERSFSPFGRAARVHELAPTDRLLLAGEPLPLTISVPVKIER